MPSPQPSPASGRGSETDLLPLPQGGEGEKPDLLPLPLAGEGWGEGAALATSAACDTARRTARSPVPPARHPATPSRPAAQEPARHTPPPAPTPAAHKYGCECTPAHRTHPQCRTRRTASARRRPAATRSTCP